MFEFVRFVLIPHEGGKFGSTKSASSGGKKMLLLQLLMLICVGGRVDDGSDVIEEDFVEWVC